MPKAKGGRIGGKAYRDKQEALRESISSSSMDVIRGSIRSSLRRILEMHTTDVKRIVTDKLDGEKIDEEMIKNMIMVEILKQINSIISSQ